MKETKVLINNIKAESIQKKKCFSKQEEKEIAAKSKRFYCTCRESSFADRCQKFAYLRPLSRDKIGSMLSKKPKEIRQGLFKIQDKNFNKN